MKNLLLLSMLLFCIPLSASQSSTSETAVELSERVLKSSILKLHKLASINAHYRIFVHGPIDKKCALITKILFSGSKEQLKELAVYNDRLRRVSDAQTDCLRAKLWAQSMEIRALKDQLQATVSQLQQTKNDLELVRKLHRRCVNPQAQNVVSTFDRNMEKFKQLALEKK